MPCSSVQLLNLSQLAAQLPQNKSSLPGRRQILSLVRCPPRPTKLKPPFPQGKPPRCCSGARRDLGLVAPCCVCGSLGLTGLVVRAAATAAKPLFSSSCSGSGLWNHLLAPRTPTGFVLRSSPGFPRASIPQGQLGLAGINVYTHVKLLFASTFHKTKLYQMGYILACSPINSAA